MSFRLKNEKNLKKKNELQMGTIGKKGRLGKSEGRRHGDEVGRKVESKIEKRWGRKMVRGSGEGP